MAKVNQGGNNEEEIIQTGPLEKYLKIAASDLVTELNITLPPATAVSNVHGWQIRLLKDDPSAGLISFQYVEVKESGGMGSILSSDMSKYELIESADIVPIEVHVLPSGGVKFDKAYKGEQVASTSITGPFTEDFLTLQEEVHFFYLTRKDLEIMLLNDAEYIYISKCSADYMGGIASLDGTSFVMLKFECTKDGDSLQFSLNNMAPIPLFVFAPPCPPRWNDTFGGGNPGYVARIGTNLASATDNDQA